LQSKRKTETDKVQIQLDPNIDYDVFFKIFATAGTAGYADIGYTSKLNGNNHTERIVIGRDRGNGNASLGVLAAISSSKPELSENYLYLVVLFSTEDIEIVARGESLSKIFYEECQDGKTTKLCVLHKESEKDPGKIDMSVYAYDELAKSLIMIHNRFIDSPDIDEMVILPEDSMAIWKVLQLHREARTAGFSKINFSKLNSK